MGDGSVIPTPYTVTREAYEPTQDSHGAVVDGWGSPASVPVYGWAPPGSDDEPFEAGRAAVERDMELYAPTGTPGGPKDRWTLSGVQYLQVGHPDDYSTGPWSVEFGVVINLKRVEG